MPDLIEEPRPYRLPDADMLTFARAKLRVFEAHAADFIALDPVFGSTFATQWEAAIDACYAHPTDELMLDGLRHRSEEVTTATRAAAQTVADLRYFASRAFGTEGLYRVFHFHEHDRMRQRTAWYTLYLQTQHTLAVRYATELQAKGMTPAQIAAIAAAANQLAAAELAQETFKRERLRRTVQRKDVMAAMWAYLQQVHRAAQVIYAEDEVMRNIFALDPPNH